LPIRTDRVTASGRPWRIRHAQDFQHCERVALNFV
jgi:hypothetical protein